jgi:hypothetical protein
LPQWEHASGTVERARHALEHLHRGRGQRHLAPAGLGVAQPDDAGLQVDAGPGDPEQLGLPHARFDRQPRERSHVGHLVQLGEQALLLVALQASLARRILRKPGVTLKLDAGYLDYADRSDLYWDPVRYLTEGLTAILRQEIAPKVSLQIEARVGYGQEESQGSLERSFGASLALVEVAGLTAELGYRYGETGRVGSVGGGNGNGYVAHSGTIAVRYGFGS